ncbi:hypothetical protein DFJ74DRAFT_716310 [Hyaloraphidium curvatum]|nr:hypothetical protein DFJ74DRAFT_716310 [Hyaloraphidium curvatum]
MGDKLFSALVEWTLLVLSLAYFCDEAKAAIDSGLRIYLSSIWNWFDVATLGLLAAFFAVRWVAIAQGSQELRKLAFDLLAVANCIVWPRAFAALDRFRYFGTMIIIVRSMVYDSSLFFVLMGVNLLGFTQGLYAVSRPDDPDADPGDTPHPSWFEILYELILVWIGFYFRALDFAVALDPVFGSILIVVFLAITNLLLLNLLISIFAQSFSKVIENAEAEFQFSLALRVVEHALADVLYPFLPPFNLVELAILPLKLVLPHHSYEPLTRGLLKIVCAPFLVAIWLAELLSVLGKSDEQWRASIEEAAWWYLNPTDTEGWVDPETGDRRGVPSIDVPESPTEWHHHAGPPNSMDRVTVLPVRKGRSSIRFADEVGEESADGEEGAETEGDDVAGMLAALLRETRAMNARLERLERRMEGGAQGANDGTTDGGASA